MKRTASRLKGAGAAAVAAVALLVPGGCSKDKEAAVTVDYGLNCSADMIEMFEPVVELVSEGNETRENVLCADNMTWTTGFHLGQGYPDGLYTWKGAASYDKDPMDVWKGQLLVSFKLREGTDFSRWDGKEVVLVAYPSFTVKSGNVSKTWEPRGTDGKDLRLMTILPADHMRADLSEQAALIVFGIRYDIAYTVGPALAQ